MFPRRRTDQVYATLQQVQRRITEASGSPTSAATPAGMSAPAGRTPIQSPNVRTGPNVPSSDPPPSPPMLAPGVAAHQRYAVVLSGTLATLLIVCWLASLAVAIVITAQVRRPPVATSTDGPRISVPPPAAEASRWKLIVQVEPRATPEARRTLAKTRDDFNRVMEKNRSRGWQPWFEIEEPVNGSLQLVFAPKGVDKNENQWVELAKALKSSRWTEVQ